MSCILNIISSETPSLTLKSTLFTCMTVLNPHLIEGMTQHTHWVRLRQFLMAPGVHAAQRARQADKTAICASEPFRAFWSPFSRGQHLRGSGWVTLREQTRPETWTEQSCAASGRVEDGLLGQNEILCTELRLLLVNDISNLATGIGKLTIHLKSLVVEATLW